MIIYKIGSDGFWDRTNDYEVADGVAVPEGFTSISPDIDNPDGTKTGLYKPKWADSAWIEGMTQTEIEAINNPPQEPSIEDRLSAAESAISALMGV